MSYVDGFVLVVPTKKLPAYTKLAKLAAKVWKENGALEYYECALEDGTAPMGIPFPKLTAAKKNETVMFSWITYKSKAHRNAVNKKVMNDQRLLQLDHDDMPFDLKRMTYGGFKPIVKA
ncbi:MAG TPA: DUF1428 domain-containing protein [Patescibacteria group bacterium]|nr:DUF1428 domain-containing protein [Patescibacteria group bacterium]